MAVQVPLHLQYSTKEIQSIVNKVLSNKLGVSLQSKAHCCLVSIFYSISLLMEKTRKFNSIIRPRFRQNSNGFKQGKDKVVIFAVNI